ncbi:hypothetical protein NCCP2495_19170 [Dietzia sp. NCCP-2495]|uniref:PspC domain-containing protein n=1 Tax=Dietzia sp. NCCP-2495 TaxID=2934675 RepID=UPI00222E24A9|nr:PspC domain-containing protein [Dietzia sp. NCCP-2495]GLB64038.1 hypothetical protein NCCP2495_19170 [Dietzia sp. NCCP-2495]
MTSIPTSGNPSGAKRLVRSDDRWIGGVAGGVANYFGVDPTLVRILFAAALLLPGPQVLLYLILWLVMPNSGA